MKDIKIQHSSFPESVAKGSIKLKIIENRKNRTGKYKTNRTKKCSFSKVEKRKNRI